MQRESSIEDQVRAAQRVAEAQGLGPGRVFADAGLSGASLAKRPGLADLRDAIASGRTSAVIVESLDRLSRDQADLAFLWREIRSAGVRLITVAEGEIRDDPSGVMQVGLRAMIGEIYLRDVAHKTRRGLEGVVNSGRHAGPPPYGYRLKPGGQPGELEIDETAAAIVRRICDAYASGQSPRALAHALNAEGIKSPGGGVWRASTIQGDRARGNGILWNALYRGERIWNRNRKVKDAVKGTARMVANPPEAWLRLPAPELAILDADTIAAIEARHAAIKGPADRARRPKRPLSGLLTCGSCGGHMVIGGGNPSRYVCASRKETGLCTDSISIITAEAERRAFAALTANMLQPEAIKLAVETYRKDRARLAAQSTQRRAPLEKRIADLRGEERRLVAAFATGRLPESALERVTEAETERKALEAELDQIRDHTAQPTQLHPNAADAYARIIQQLETVLSGIDDAGGAIDARARTEAIETVRSLIQRITVSTNKESRDVDLQVEGDLAALLTLSMGSHRTPQPSRAGSTIALGAGARTGRYLTRLPPFEFAA
jgi:DNA invertase Pin-like site-specific DNA recombinase